jgi:hypothetical protein
MNSSGIVVFFTIVLIAASVTSLSLVPRPQQAIANTTRIGVLTIPITCNSLGDIMGAVSGVLSNATTAGGNETNSTQGMGGLMKALSGVLGNATTAGGGGNETGSMQGIMASGMGNMSQSKLQQLNNLVFCNLANEKTIRSMMK